MTSTWLARKRTLMITLWRLRRLSAQARAIIIHVPTHTDGDAGEGGGVGMRAAEFGGRRTGGEERRRGGGVWRSSGELGGVATTWEECGGVGRSAREGGVRRRAEESE